MPLLVTLAVHNYEYFSTKIAFAFEISGCGKLHIMDGIWKIFFTVCAMRSEVRTEGMVVHELYFFYSHGQAESELAPTLLPSIH